MLDQITPIILTYNEAPNIGRSLERLRWAKDIVIVDSFSQDETLDIVSSFAQARVYQRTFDTFARQWTFALNRTEIKNDWVLGLDADFLLTDELVDELRNLHPACGTNAYRAQLRYCVGGKALRFSLLPPLVVLYKRSATSYSTDAHTYHVEVNGEISDLRNTILHDDRKPLRRWVRSQRQYALLETAKLQSANPDELNVADRVRRLRVIAPAAIFFYCLCGGGIFDGWRGFYYATQRAFAEFLLSLYLVLSDLQILKRRSETTTAENASTNRST